MFFIVLISRLPFRILFLISDFLFFVAFYVIRYRRKLVWKNLLLAFPEKSEHERREIERSFYRNLCDYAVETVKLITISKAELARRMVHKNPGVVNQYLAGDQSVIILATHQFNWEWLLTSGCIAYGPNLDFVYQSVNSRFFDNLSRRMRTRFGAFGIRREEVAREVLRRKDKTRGIAILGDQYPGLPGDRKFHVSFLNEDTVFFYAANQLAWLTQYPVVFQGVKRVGRGQYETSVIPLGNPPYAKNDDGIVLTYVRLVEESIREDPSNWLWSHDRWKKRHLSQA